MARLCALGLGLGVWVAGGLRAEPRDWSHHVAVIYAETDEPSPGQYSQLIAAIENNPEVVVYRFALRENTELADAEAVISPRAKSQSRAVMLALNDAENAIAVIYPDIGEPYRSIFSQIIEGIEEKTRTRVASYAIGTGSNLQDISGELKKHDIRVVIALGRNGLKTANSFGRDINVVGGGVISVPESETRGMTVLSLAPDPALLFARLKAMKPAVRRVVVVFDPRQNAWLIRLAREAAAANGIELAAYESADLKTSMRIYQEILGSIDVGRDALWLPQDSTTVEESSMLPFLLQEAWTRSLLVFSSNAAHVKRGALFSLYPNNKGLGHSLANSAISQGASGATTQRGVLPLKDVLVAVNVRTAAHLGISTNPKQQGYDMVFPEQ